MTKSRGEDRSVRSLLGQKFRIDYYQRDYKWEPKQIRELVEDLTTRFLQDYEPHHEHRAVAQYGQYFLGSIIMSEKDGERVIVDGQQRLTSLTLLLIHLDRLHPQLRMLSPVQTMISLRPGRISFTSFRVARTRFAVRRRLPFGASAWTGLMSPSSIDLKRWTT